MSTITTQRALGLAEQAGFAALGRKSDGSVYTTLSGESALKLVRLIEAELAQNSISVRGSERWHEVMQQERDDQRRDERRAQIARGD